MRWLLLLASLAAWRSQTVRARYDENYYPAIVQKQLEQTDIYYMSARIVLEQLNSFESLFVKYHSCTYVGLLRCKL